MKLVFKVEDRAYRIIQTVAIILLVAMTCLFFAQTMLRFTLGIAWSWAEELCRYMLIWAVFLESGIGVTKGVHVGFDLVSSRLHGRTQTVVYMIIQIVVIALSTQLVRGGWTLTMQVRNQLSASLGISMAYFYSAIVVGGILLIIFSAFNILRKAVKAQ